VRGGKHAKIAKREKPCSTSDAMAIVNDKIALR